MSIFPTKILLATDGSREAELAARTAADLAQKTHLLIPSQTSKPQSLAALCNPG
jgi:nucleotide-binding universal stress UspA family protein